jgi:hypothetical protein
MIDAAPSWHEGAARPGILPTMRHCVWLGLVLLSCTTSTPGGPESSEQAATAGDAGTKVDSKPPAPDTAEPDNAKPAPDKAEPEPNKADPVEPAPAEPAPVDPATLAPYYYVTLGDTPQVLVRAWGWGCMTDAERQRCEANAPSVGAMMACGTRDKPKGAAKLVRELKLRLDQTKPAAPQQIADWAPTPPRELWLIGTKSTCKAKLGSPLVSVYSVDPDSPRLDLSDEFTILELSWTLSGCKLDEDTWASLAVPALPGDDTPAELRYQVAELGARERIDPATWTGALASTLPALQTRAFAHTNRPPDAATPDWWTQAAAIPGTAFGERHFALLWRQEPADPATPDKYPCGTDEYGVTIRTRDDATPLRADEPKCEPSDDDCEDDDDERDLGELAGAFVRAGKVEHVVWSDGLDYTAAPLRGDVLGEPVDILTGGHHPESGGNGSYTVVPYCGP